MSRRTPDDEPFLREMLHLGLFVPPGAPPFPRTILGEPAVARYIDGWGSRERDVGVIAMVDGAAVGAALGAVLFGDRTGLWAHRRDRPALTMTMCEPWRGRGVGTALLNQPQDTLSAISPSCDPGEPGVAALHRMGFRVLPDGTTMLWTRAPAAIQGGSVRRVVLTGGPGS